MKKVKILSAILVAISAMTITAYANPADFHAKYNELIDMYSDANSLAYVVDINNDAVPELLCLSSDSENRYYVGDVLYVLYGIDTTTDEARSITGKASMSGDINYFYVGKGIDGIVATTLYSDNYGRIYVNRYDSIWGDQPNGLGWAFNSELMYFDGERRTIEKYHISEPDNPGTYLSSRKYFSNPQSYADAYNLKVLLTASDSIGFKSSMLDPHPYYPTDPWSTWIGPAVMMNGSLVRFDDAKPYIANDRTMIPMRKLFELLGAKIDWNDQTKTVTSTLNGTTVSLTIGQNTMYINGKKVEIDAPAVVNYDRTYVPLRAISEALNAKIEWDGSNKVVYIEQ